MTLVAQRGRCPRCGSDPAGDAAFRKAIAEQQAAKAALKPMTAQRAVYFMERFKHEEKLLGPNEQAALDFVIAMLEAPTATPAPAPAPGAPEHLPTVEHIRELAREHAGQIMEQAQVFASAWSLVGGRFDTGNGMSDAEDAKAELRTMVHSLADLAAETVRPVPCAAVAPEEPVAWYWEHFNTTTGETTKTGFSASRVEPTMHACYANEAGTQMIGTRVTPLFSKPPVQGS